MMQGQQSALQRELSKRAQLRIAGLFPDYLSHGKASHRNLCGEVIPRSIYQW